MRESVPWKPCGEDVKVVSWQSHAGPGSLGYEQLGDWLSRNYPTRGAERHPCEYAGRNVSEPKWSVVNRTADWTAERGRSRLFSPGEDP